MGNVTRKTTAIVGIGTLTTLATLIIGMDMVNPRPAHAWKPKTHVYLAEQALKDALDNGKVTIYQTDYKTGKIVGVLGEYDVDARILAALRQAPKQFRAGVLGPDAYPDILTGQQVIHPEESTAVDSAAGGSNAWLTQLWRRAFEADASPQVRAFVVGYLTHTAGDIFAHTFVNHFSGGEFMLVPDPQNAVKHLVLEGYIGKRTPQTISAFTTRVRTGGPLNQRKQDDLGIEGGEATYSSVNHPITQEDTSIADVENFIYEEMTFARPGSILQQKLLQGDSAGHSVPLLFSTLRNGLQKQVEEYDRIRLSKTGPDRVAYAVANGPGAEYKRAWIADIDAGLKAWPATSHELAKALVYNEGGVDIARAREVMSKYQRDHLASMVGVPDAVVATAAFISDVINAIIPLPLKEAMSALMRAPLDFLVASVTSKSIDEWADYLKNPETHFDEVLNRPGGGHDGAQEHLTTLAAFNRDHLKINDSGYQNMSLKWQINDVPAAFNTLQMTKMLLLGESGMRQLSTALQAKGAAMGTLPQPFQNTMLGWVRSLDQGNQWQGFPNKNGAASPRPVFSANNGAAYQKLFLPQTGEKDWMSETAPHDATPAPGTPAPGTPGGTTTLPPPGTATGTQPPNSSAPLPLPTTPPSPTFPTAPTEFRPGAAEGFLPLRYFEVRVDKVAPNIAGDTLEIFCTFKNRTTQEQFINGSMIYSVATDADGVGHIGYGFYRPVDAPDLMAGNQAVGAGGEFKARLLVKVPDGVVPFKTLTLWETSSLPQTVDISSLVWPDAKPAANLPALNLKSGTGEFKACGKALDIRFDGFRKARDGAYEAVFTFKNTSEETRHSEMLEMTSSSLNVFVHNAGGAKHRHDAVARANGDKAIPMTHHLAIIAGSEARVRYRFQPNAAFVPSKISVTDPASGTTVEWSVAVISYSDPL